MTEWLKVRGPSRVLSLADDTAVSDQAVLLKLDGVRPDLHGDVLSDYLDEGQRSEWRVSGGSIELKLTDLGLMVETHYEIDAPLTDDQCLLLLDFTVSQWADGFRSCADGLGTRDTTVTIWGAGSIYALSASWLPRARRVTWTLEEKPRPHRVAAFAD